jgi:hypothetical protein
MLYRHPVTTYASGTQAGSVGVELFLSSPNAAGIYTLHVDTVNMQAIDRLELRVYQMVLTAGTQRVVYRADYDGAQPTDALIKTSLAVGNELTDTNSLRFSLTQTHGTSRNFPWKVTVM